MVQGESPKEQKELLFKARPMIQVLMEERTWIFGSGIMLGMGACFAYSRPGRGRPVEKIAYALNDPKLCLCVFFLVYRYSRNKIWMTMT